MWALAWDCKQLIAILSGDTTRLLTFFDANIFYPLPLTLAYSEHFVAQALQILPIYALTENPVLCYNLLFLSTFVLSGLGGYLFVRELTGSAMAGAVAGLLFAFAPYRIPQSSHLQVLSSQWMPFALYGFRRYFETRRLRPLAGAAAALTVQNLSCGYYLLYFSPFAAAYVVWEIASRGLWRHATVFRDLCIAAVVVIAFTVPLLLPYAAVRKQLQLERAPGEVMRYSADVYSYATAFGEQPIWGGIADAFPKAEAQLFPGIVTLLLATIGLFTGATTPRPTVSSSEKTTAPWRRWLAVILAAGVIVHVVAIVSALVFRRITLDLGLLTLRITDVNQLLARSVILGIALLAVSPFVRARTTAYMKTRGFFLVAALAAVWLSLGPSPLALGRPLNLMGPYRLLYDYVPGFEGLRVPARFGMIVTLMLAILAGFGAARIARFRAAPFVLGLAALAFLSESLVFPFVINGMEPPRGLNAPEARVHRPSRAPEVYKEIARQADNVVLAELPLGQTDFDLRAMYYSTVHWRPLLNGYSGYFPPHYGTLRVALADLPRHGDLAWDVLSAAKVTHVLVHEGAYLGDEGPLTTSTLRERGAAEVFRSDRDVLLKLP
jgi:hypothetical protein